MVRDNVKRYPDGWGEPRPLTRLVFCAGCGGKCYCHRLINGKKIPTFVCGNYGKIPIVTKCQSRHAISAEVLQTLISTTLNEVKKIIEIDESELIE